MKSILLLILGLLFASSIIRAQAPPPLPHDNFQGIITYQIITEDYPPDTLVCYFGKDKIRIQRLGRLVDQYGIADMLYDFSDTNLTTQTVVFFNTGEVKYFERIGGGVSSIQEHDDQILLFDSLQCKHHTVFYLPHEAFDAMFNKNKEVYHCDQLKYIVPAHHLFETEFLFGTPSGNIALETRLHIHSTFSNGMEKTSTTIDRAIKIEPMELPEAYFDLY